MALYAYHTLDEIASFLNVRAEWLKEELEAFGAPCLVLGGRRLWFADDIYQFLRKRSRRIEEHQRATIEETR